MSAWLILNSHRMCDTAGVNFKLEQGRFLSITTEWPDTSFTLSAKICWQESRLNDQFLEGRKLLGTFLSKGWKFYIIAFLTFLSQHFDQEREGFFFQSKHGSERELNLWPRSIFTLVQIERVRLKSCGQRKSANTLSDLEHSPRIGTCSRIKLWLRLCRKKF